VIAGSEHDILANLRGPDNAKEEENMKARTLTYISAITLFAALAVPVRLSAQQPPYTIIDLGTLGGTFSAGDSINNKDWVVGGATLPGDTALHAFLWRKGLMRDLGTLGGPNSTALFPLNERGEITGFSDTSTPEPLGEDFCGFGTNLICLPFLWQHGVMTPLPTLGGNNGQAFEINDRGQVVGVAENTTPDPTCVPPPVLQFEPVLWDKGEIHELPTFPGDPDGLALAINDQGQAVGQSGNCSTFGVHALLWQNGTVTDLGNLGGTHNNGPQDINNQGQVVGFSSLPGDTTAHAFLWQNGVMTDLGTLPGDFSSFAAAINSKGQVVGFSCQGFGEDCRAFLWQSGAMTDLNTLIPAGSPLFLLSAFSNNSRGEIVGEAFQPSTGEVHAYLAIPSNSESTSENAAPASRGEVSERPKVIIPENVRKQLRQRLGPRYHVPNPKPAESGTGSKETAEQPLSCTAGNGMANYLSDGVQPPNVIYGGDHCLASGGVLTGRCVGVCAPGGYCCTRYDPGQCPTGQKVKSLVLEQCRNGRFYVDRLTSCTP
jgi:probable HAF family extracellular repeat protein